MINLHKKMDVAADRTSAARQASVVRHIIDCATRPSIDNRLVWIPKHNFTFCLIISSFSYSVRKKYGANAQRCWGSTYPDHSSDRTQEC